MLLLLTGALVIVLWCTDTTAANVMERDAKVIRGNKSYVFVNCKNCQRGSNRAHNKRCSFGARPNALREIGCEG